MGRRAEPVSAELLDEMEEAGPPLDLGPVSLPVGW
jgi:hypothetical protein